MSDGQFYPSERVNQVDMRFARIVRLSRTGVDIGIDLYNLFNTNDATAFDQSVDWGVADGGEWLRPTTIVAPRFARFNVTFTF